MQCRHAEQRRLQAQPGLAIERGLGQVAPIDQLIEVLRGAVALIELRPQSRATACE
jgi:hypothetical protein